MKINESFTELSARERAEALLDREGRVELLGPFSHLKSPHLLKQGIVPQNDDGMIVMKGSLEGQDAVVIAMEGKFQGGGIGEISGAKFAAALEQVLRENEAGHKVCPVVVMDTGGVRLQEANYGLLAIAEIQDLLISLREYVPVVALIPGKVGCFGGMSMTCSLFSYIIMTREGRLTLNGPEVIEQEAGVAEWDSSDKAFPSLSATAFPAMEAAKASQPDENAARLFVLLKLMSCVEDTNILFRSDRQTLRSVQQISTCFLHSHPVLDGEALCKLREMNWDFIRLGISPGGCADLLAVTLFKDNEFQVWITDRQENLLCGVNVSLFQLVIQPGQIQPHTLQIVLQNTPIHNQLGE